MCGYRNGTLVANLEKGCNGGIIHSKMRDAIEMFKKEMRYIWGLSKNKVSDKTVPGM